MEKEQVLLLRLINGAIKNQKVEYSTGEVDVKKLLTLAKRHSVLNTVYPALNESEKKLAAGVYAACVNQHALLDYYSGVIFEKFEENGVCYMPLKGAVIRKLYPNPLMRSSCDVDIFYKTEDTEKVNKILADIGFDFIADGENHMFHQLGKTVTVEMHHDLLESDKNRAWYYDGVWDRLQKRSEYEYAFSNEDFYIYLLLHMYKHFNHGGFGARSIVDVYIYNQKNSLDKSYLDSEFEKLQIKKFVSAIEMLADVWFNDAPVTDLTTELSEFIFSSGVYGTVKNAAVTNIAKNNKVKYFFTRAFPPVATMKRIFPSLNKCILHLPFMYVIRLITAPFSKKHKGAAKSEIATLFTSTKSDSEKISKLFKQLEIND